MLKRETLKRETNRFAAVECKWFSSADYADERRFILSRKKSQKTKRA
jgi:hypothetical protein